MKRNLLTLTLLAGVAMSMSARERTIAEMQSAAAQALGNTTAAAKVKVQSAQPLRVLSQQTELTVLGYDNGGFAIVANDDMFKPVFGYSDTQFSAGNTAPGLQWYIEALNNTLAEAKAKGQPLKEVERSAKYKDAVGELLTCRWGQDTPYNDQCPYYTEGGQKKNFVTGCVATAMAQVLYYHKYPTQGKGKVTYRFAPGNGIPAQTLTANFGETTYDWDHMRDTYTEGNYTTEEANAVATIMYQCGVAVQMGYTKDGSGAYSDKACKALRKYFGCKEWNEHYYRYYFNSKEWMNIIYRELNDNCPIIYCGQSKSGGHCFVLDGYREDGYVHVNWGWNGQSNGYFDINSLQGYSAQQTMLPVRPATDERVNPVYMSDFQMENSIEMDDNGSKVEVNAEAMYNFDIDEFTGDIVLMARNMATGKDVNLGTLKHVEAIMSLYGTELSGATASVSRLSDGDWRLYVASLGEEETTPQPVRTDDSHGNSYIMTIKNGRIVNSKFDIDSSWTADDGNTTGIGTIVSNDNNANGIVRVYDAAGRQVYSAVKSQFNINNVPASGVLVVKNGNKTTKVIK